MRLKHSKLTPKQTLWLCEHFVAGTPARTAADLIGVNKNTAALFYHRLRQIIGDRMQGNERFILGAMVALSVGFGLTVLRTLQTSIKVRRERLRRVRESFGEPFKTARSVCKENDPVPGILAIAQIAGALVAGWLVVAWL